MRIARMTENKTPIIILGAVIAMAFAGLYFSVSAQAMSLDSILKTLTVDEHTPKTSVVSSAEKAAAQSTPGSGERTAQSQNNEALASSAQPAVGAIQAKQVTTASLITTDMAPAVKSLAAAQSQQFASAVTYPTQRIDLAKRDQLYTIAASIILIGVSLYTMTLLRVSSYTPASVQRRPLFSK